MVKPDLRWWVLLVGDENCELQVAGPFLGTSRRCCELVLAGATGRSRV